MTRRLSKSRFQTGLQCPKALWLTVHEPGLKDPDTEQRTHIFDTGTAVGELARSRFPDGVLITQDHTQSEEALRATQRLFDDPPSAIFEAALFHEGVFVRPDVMVRVGGDEWDLYEVKSSTRVKAENISDVAIQTWVLEGSGQRIRRAFLMHLDNTYVFAGGEYDLTRLFIAEDVTAEARAWMPHVPSRVAEMLRMLDGAMPDVRIGAHCKSPYTCSFHGYCHSFLPEKPVTALPRINPQLLDSLLTAGIHCIADVPLDYPGLTATQREVVAVLRSGEARLVGDLATAFDDLRYPLHFLDFETMMSALPLWASTRPWQQVPFQWSDHILHHNGDLVHREFLHTETSDPRPAFIESLLDTLGDTGSIVVYSAFENTRLNELAAFHPDQAKRIAAVQARIFDLLPVVRRHVRHPATLGSSSIKAVLPALVPDLSYDGLEIAEGGTASLRYLHAVTGRLTGEDVARTFAALREYCGTDTLAMVRLYQVLQAT